MELRRLGGQENVEHVNVRKSVRTRNREGVVVAVVFIGCRSGVLPAAITSSQFGPLDSRKREASARLDPIKIPFYRRGIYGPHRYTPRPTRLVSHFPKMQPMKSLASQKWTQEFSLVTVSPLNGKLNWRNCSLVGLGLKQAKA